MTFEDCLYHCIANKEFVREFNRLTGHHLGEKRDGITKAIDEACQYDPDMEAMPDFVEFIYGYIWSRLPQESR